MLKRTIIFIFIFLAGLFFSFSIWKKDRITVDAPSYYTYLPACLIHQDLKLKFIDSDPEFYRDKIWYYRLPDGNRLIKHPVGLSIMLSPFFLAGHICAKASGAVQDGYSMPYQNAASIGVLFYLMTGLIFLGKLLLQYVPEKAAALTLLVTVLGTNLLWYSSAEGLMPHAISFSLLSVCLYAFFSWLRTAERRYLLAFAIAFALSVLIRPLALTIFLYFLLFAVIHKGGMNELLSFLKPQWKNIFLAILVFAIVVSPQLLYWHYISGKWILDVYMDEHFVFGSPQFFPFLFSFRKGLFVYSPLLLFSIAGLIIAWKRHKAVFWSTLLIFILTVFLLSSWWAWSYGISWGMRPMIDYYCILAIPMALAFSTLMKKRLTAICLYVLCALLVLLNLFQTWQYSKGLIHYDDMTREAYFKGFFQTKMSPGWQVLLSPYDWERRIKGLPQPDYSAALFNSLDEHAAIRLRATNGNFVALNARAQNAIAAYQPATGEDSEFFIRRMPGALQIALIGPNGKIASIRPDLDMVLTASSDMMRNTDLFSVEFLEEDDNRIALKAANGKYLSADPGFPFLLRADAEHVGPNETFRYFVTGK